MNDSTDMQEKSTPQDTSQVPRNAFLLGARPLRASRRQGQSNAWRSRIDQEDQQPKARNDHRDEGAETMRDELHDLMTTTPATNISDRKDLDTSELVLKVGEEGLHEMMPLLENIIHELTKTWNLEKL